MKRGEIWTASGSGGYAGKPRPAVILQGDEFSETETLTLASFTSDPAEADLFRILVEPDEENGLKVMSRVVVDKITTLPRSKFGKRVGRLSDDNMRRIDEAVIRFLGLVSTALRKR